MLTEEYLKKWLRATGIRCLRTFAITFIGLVPVNVALDDLKFGFIFGSCLISSVVCFFTCIAGIPEIEDEKEIVMKNVKKIKKEEMEEI